MIKHLIIKLMAIGLALFGSDSCYAWSRFFTFDKGVLTDSLLIELCEDVIYPIAKENNVDWRNLVLCITEYTYDGTIEVDWERGLNVLTYYDNKQKDMDYVIVTIGDIDVQVYLPKHYGLVKRTGGKRVIENYDYDNPLFITSDRRIFWKFEFVDGKCRFRELYDSSDDFLRRYIYQALLSPSLRTKKLDDSIRLPRKIFEIVRPPQYSAPIELELTEK